MNITLSEIERYAEEDVELVELRNALEFDYWPPELRKYEAQKKSLHYIGSLICKDGKIVLPAQLRRKALTSAHGGHVGEVAMKRIMREFFWWPKMAVETEIFVKGCQTCCMLSRKNPPLPISSRDLPEAPWDTIQIDFLSIPGFGAGEFLIVVDTYSRYLLVKEMKRLTAEATNEALCEIFKSWGCPRVLQSDNGPPFGSSAFCSFWETRGVSVRKSIPFSPQSNGMVERHNQPIIKAVSASKIEGINWRTSLETYVHNHNTLVPHARLNVTPFELLVGWKYRGTFPSLWNERHREVLDREDIREKDAETKLSSKKHADIVRGARNSNIKIGDTVLLSQIKRSKTDPQFSAERYTVVARDGAKVVVVSATGVQYVRNVGDIRLAPSPWEAGTGEGMEDTQSVQDEEQEATSLRRRGGLKRPSRFDDNFIYNIYQ